MLEFVSMRVLRAYSIALKNSSPVIPAMANSPPYRARFTYPLRAYLFVCGLYINFADHNLKSYTVDMFATFSL
jgi:hypothetical protein